MNNSPSHAGRVTLVGAGPGDADLLTLRGLAALREADCVLYDALVDPRVLDFAPPQAQRIDVGKRARAHRLPQEQTNDLMVRLARAGRRVVRLKGGDPYLFGRGAEEVAHLASRGVPCEVVPGVTAATAATACAGIPLTHRRYSSAVLLMTGHLDLGKSEGSLPPSLVAALAQAGATLCVFMGSSRLESFRDSLVKEGLPASTPAALVQWGATPRQRVARAPLGELPATVAGAGLGAPSLILVGPVAALDVSENPGLDFYVRRPLFGVAVMTTRATTQAGSLTHRLLALGAEVVEAPAITIEPASAQDLARVDHALLHLRDYHWLVLTSANGVEALAERLNELDRRAPATGPRADARLFAGLRIAAIGDATAQALLDRLGIRPDLVPERFVAQALAQDLLARSGAGSRFLLLRADIARPELRDTLLAAGHAVDDLPIYRTNSPQRLPEHALDALRAGRLRWVTFTSASTVHNLVQLLGPDAQLLKSTRLASIGPITSGALREHGLTPTVEAARSDIDGLVCAMVEAHTSA